MKVLLISFCVLALAACGSKKIHGDGTGQTITTKKPVPAVPAQLGYSKRPVEESQPFTIQSASLSESVLTVTVQYAGGCEDHLFTLEGSEQISKSLPPIRSIRLVSSGKKDLCKALIVKTLTFDVTPLAYSSESGSQITLNLEGLANGSFLFKLPNKKG
jgi:hypothetical protein